MEILKKYLYTNFPKQFGYYVHYREVVLHRFKKILLNLNFNIYFSTKDQDRWVAEDIFKFKENGFFVDLAATSGIIDNNTYFLEKKLNWRGICIEPNEYFFKKLKQNRAAICINDCVDDCEKTVEFINDGGLSGILDTDTDNNYEMRNEKIQKYKKRSLVEYKKTKTLTSILDENNAPLIIDYLSLDIEGAEERALVSFDFEKYRFLSMTIERPSKKLHDILINNGYVFVKHFKVDSFYLHNSIKKNVNINFETYIELPKKKW